MPLKRLEWLKRVKAVEREYTATRFPTDYLLSAVRQDTGMLRGDLRVRDVERSSEQLEGTYLIRLFAEFETGLRRFHESVPGKPPPYRTRDLLDSVGAKCRVPHQRIEDAHGVREFRNALVHEGEEPVEPISIEVARSRLCHFLSFLADAW